MTRVLLEYSDQNEAFSSCLPKEGRVAQRLTESGGVDDWYLVELDESISYQLKIGEPFQFRLLETSKVLIRSRWQGFSVGATEPTSVFLLLVEPAQLPLTEPIYIKNFYHAAWAMCSTLVAQHGVQADRP